MFYTKGQCCKSMCAGVSNHQRMNGHTFRVFLLCFWPHTCLLPVGSISTVNHAAQTQMLNYSTLSITHCTEITTFFSAAVNYIQGFMGVCCLVSLCSVYLLQAHSI